MTSCLLHVVEDAESRYHKVIDVPDNDVQDVNAKKRTIDYLRESMAVLRACKRQFVASLSASATPLSTTSPTREPSSSPANSIPEPSFQPQVTSAESSSSGESTKNMDLEYRVL